MQLLGQVLLPFDHEVQLGLLIHSLQRLIVFRDLFVFRRGVLGTLTKYSDPRNRLLQAAIQHLPKAPFTILGIIEPLKL